MRVKRFDQPLPPGSAATQAQPAGGCRPSTRFGQLRTLQRTGFIFEPDSETDCILRETVFEGGIDTELLPFPAQDETREQEDVVASREQHLRGTNPCDIQIQWDWCNTVYQTLLLSVSPTVPTKAIARYRLVSDNGAGGIHSGSASGTTRSSSGVP